MELDFIHDSAHDVGNQTTFTIKDPLTLQETSDIMQLLDDFHSKSGYSFIVVVAPDHKNSLFSLSVVISDYQDSFFKDLETYSNG